MGFIVVYLRLFYDGFLSTSKDTQAINVFSLLELNYHT